MVLNLQKISPVDGIKSLGDVELDEKAWHFRSMELLDDVLHI
jgi:hypothetical protein